MDKFVAHAAARPATAKHRLIPIEPLLTDLATAGFNPQQHGLPVTTGLPNTHDAGV